MEKQQPEKPHTCCIEKKRKPPPKPKADESLTANGGLRQRHTLPKNNVRTQYTRYT